MRLSAYFTAMCVHEKSRTPAGISADSSGDARAFSRLDLLVLLSVVALLVICSLPLLAASGGAANRVTCINNLARLGKAYASWGHDHGDRYPWQVPTSEGGTQVIFPSDYLPHVRAISNELVTPRVLVCPTDSRTSVATTFAGLFSVSQASYFISHPTLDRGRAVLAGDRNVTGATAMGCPILSSLSRGFANPSSNAAWNLAMHAGTGQLLFNDGSVAQTAASELHVFFSVPGSDDTAFHFLPPE